MNTISSYHQSAPSLTRKPRVGIPSYGQIQTSQQADVFQARASQPTVQFGGKVDLGYVLPGIPSSSRTPYQFQGGIKFSQEEADLLAKAIEQSIQNHGLPVLPHQFDTNPLREVQPGEASVSFQTKQIQALQEQITRLDNQLKQDSASVPSISKALQQGKPVTNVHKSRLGVFSSQAKGVLPEGFQYEYASIRPDGTVVSPFPAMVQLLTPLADELKSDKPVPILLQVRTPGIRQNLDTRINGIVKNIDSGYSVDTEHELKQGRIKDHHGAHTRDTILLPLAEGLMSGQVDHLGSAVAEQHLVEKLLGTHGEGEGAKGTNHTQPFYQFQVLNPDTSSDLIDARQTQMLNSHETIKQMRRRQMGFQLYKMAYTEGQTIEKNSVIASALLGAVGEPLISHLFPEGSGVAGVARTLLMSLLDVCGNVLSVMGVVNDNLNARGQTLNFKSVFGENASAKNLLTPWKMEGKAGDDLRSSIGSGLKGGAFGFFMNIPPGLALSSSHATVGERAAIGGMGGAGSAAAIPFEVRHAKEGLENSIKTLIARDLLKVPDNYPGGEEAFIQRIARQEMMSRLGTAASIKAAHPVPLIGTGAMILGSQFLGIPKHIAQTAYMSTAPVMHNVLRLVYSLSEKFIEHPRRLAQLQKVIHDPQNNDDKTNKLDDIRSILVSPSSHGLTKILGNIGIVAGIGLVLFTSELLLLRRLMGREKGLVKHAEHALEEQFQKSGETATEGKLHDNSPLTHGVQRLYNEQALRTEFAGRAPGPRHPHHFMLHAPAAGSNTPGAPQLSLYHPKYQSVNQFSYTQRPQ